VSRKRKQGVKLWQRRAGGKTGFAQLYYDLLDSDAFHDLTARQKMLYVYSVRESHGRAAAENGADERLFYMNKALRSERHHLYATSDKRGFERDMAALIEHGLVDCVISGYKNRERNLYRLSARWHNWGSPSFSMPDDVLTTHMRLQRAKDTESI